MRKISCILIFAIAGCKETYNPPVKIISTGYLVVEGDIVAGNDSTIIHLSRTTPINDTSGINKPETIASVQVESDDGDVYQLKNESNGIYDAPPLNININKKYRLHIFTADGREYASDFVHVILTPPIDSVSWIANEKGLNIYANTHNATDSAGYYRWKYVAAWEHRAKQNSGLIFDPSINYVRGRTNDEQIWRCWNIDTSRQIILFSTARLSSNTVSEKPLVHIDYASQQLMAVYSILVTQYALTKEAYEFWENLRKNTEQLGTIFDPQPFADFGNIHCLTDKNEPAIGFISACSVQQQRIYIYHNQVSWPYPYPDCKDTIVTQDKIADVFSHDTYLPVNPVASPPGAVLGDFSDCVDCRLFGGGSTVKPSYMP